MTIASADSSRNSASQMRIAALAIGIALLLILCADLASGGTTAYIVPVDSISSVPYDGIETEVGNLGMDFDVNAPILVTAIGAYDYQQDGVFNHDLVVGIFDRNLQTLVALPVTFTSASPGILEGGSRFQTLSTPIQLNAGFEGSIVAFGYSSTHYGGEYFLDEIVNQVPAWSTDDGGGLINFVGSSRYVNSAALTYPPVSDAYYAHVEFAKNQYTAGTFKFAAVPEPSSWLLACTGALFVTVWLRRRDQ